MFFEKATKIDKIFTVNLTVTFKSTAKISSIFVAFLENMNFIKLHGLPLPSNFQAQIQYKFYGYLPIFH